jgi:putative peptidoglycan lipid II flippase
MTSHKNFKRAAGLMLVAILASRVLGLVREMLIARQFRADMVSAYYAAFNLPDLLFFLLSSGALSSAFIPEFTKRFETGKQKEAWQVYSILFCFMGAVLTLATVLFWIFAKPLVSILAVPGFVTQHPELVSLTMTLTRIILPCQIFFFIGGLMMATLQSRQEFRATAAAPVIYNLGIIFGAIVLSRWFSIRGLAIGTLIGAFLGNVAYAYYWMRRLGYEFHPSLYLRHPGVVRVAKLALPVIFGLGLPQIDVIVNRWFASFVSPSAPANLNFANRLMQVPLGIFAQAAGTAILPMLAAYAARSAFDDMRSGVSYGLRAIMVESIPATVFLIVMADPLVRTLYMGGEFRPSSVAPVAILLIWYSVGIFAWAGQRIVAPGFFAMQDTLTPVLVGTVSTVIFIPLNMILMKSMGAPGIALATTIGISIHFFGMTWVLRRRLHGLEGGKVLRTVSRSVIAAVAMAVVCLGVRIGMARVVGSWQLQDGDFKRPMALAAMLRQGDTPMSRYLYSSLPRETRLTIDEYERATWNEKAVRASLVADLNKVINGPSIYDATRFDKDRHSFIEGVASLFRGKRIVRVRLSDEARSLLARNPTGERLVHLNRILLSSAYPSQIPDGGPKGGALQKRDIDDCHSLAMMFADADKPVSAYLMNRMSRETRRLLAPEIAPYILMRDLNEQIAGVKQGDKVIVTSIFGPDRVNGLLLSPKLLALAANNPSGKRLVELNRRLLEEAYPKEIVARPAARVEGKLGSLLTVLLAMLLGGAVYFALLKLFKVDEMDYLWAALRRKLFRRRGNGEEPEEGPTAPMDMGESME